jgi:hypothetical protein
MTLDLTASELPATRKMVRARRTANAAGLKRLIDEDRFPLSPRVQTLTAILARLQPPKPVPASPPRRHYEPPSKGRYSRRR